MRGCIGIFLVIASLSSAVSADESRDRLIVETVLKLEGFDYGSSSSKVKDSISRYLVKNSGSEEYYQLVERFRIAGELPALAKLSSVEKINARAAALLVEIGGEPAITAALADSGEKRMNLLMSLGSVNDPRPVAALAGMLQDKGLSLARHSARALTGSPAGQSRLLDLAESGKLAEELKQGVSLALTASVDPAIRERAAKALPSPAALGGEALPALTELVKMRGEPDKGEAVYMRSCFTCHKVGGKGIDFGPALTEIGDKLAREALYTAILDPNAAISFGYEGVAIEAGDGRKLIGYVASDGDQEVAIKVPGGALITVKAGEIKERKPLPVSLMPSTLVATMSKNDLVNLVEYLITLKK